MNLSKLLRNADKMVSYGKLNDAIEVYSEILAEDFQNTKVHELIADLYIQKKDMQRASRHLFKIASDAISAGDLQTAADVYRNITSILPRNLLAREKLLEILMKSGSKGEIIQAVRELADISTAEGNPQKTIDYLEKLHELEPANKQFAIRLADALQARGSRDKAIEVLSRVSQDGLKAGKYDEALDLLERIRLLNPANPSVSSQVAEVYEKQGKISKAVDVLETSLQGGSSAPEQLEYLARLYIKAGRNDEADRLYERLINANKKYLANVLPFVEVLIADRRIERALTLLSKIYTETTTRETRQKCAELLEEILKLDPQKLEAYQLLEAYYGLTFQFDQLAVTLLSHADAYISKCEYDRALDLIRKLMDLEPYNEEYRKKFQHIKNLHSGTGRGKPAPKATLPPVEEGEDESGFEPSGVDANFDTKVSLVTEEDVENFIVDIELLEKFGQHHSAIARLEHVLKTCPNELRLRLKLKSLYFERKMPKRAAQECLEIAKVLQLQNQKEEANHFLREAQRLNPALSNARREAPAGGETVASAHPKSQGKSEYAALRGDLSELGLLDVIQILDNAQKSGKLTVRSEDQDGVIFFNSGRIVNATYQKKSGEQAMYALVGVKGGTFDYQPSDKAFDVVIHNSNTNLLLEGLRLLDEANRDAGEGEVAFEEEPPPPSVPIPQSVVTKHSPPVAVASPVLHRLNDDNPLEDL
ncbi:MAG: tetratricopeptide repeat protein [Terriglobia bacterium]